MNKTTVNYPVIMNSDLIAPCGMNCSLCIGFLREKNRCAGCGGNRRLCRIKNCEKLKPSGSGFCFECSIFPCARLKQLDKRYRTKYGMSMLDNLEYICEHGIKSFIEKEKKRWACSECGGILSVHRDACVFCGGKKE